MNAATPPNKGRIALLDVLRGVAIFGTLGTNIWLFAAVRTPGTPTFFGGGLPWWASLDGFLTTLTLFFTNGKFLGLLTILFGVGLEIQYRSAKRRDLPWPIRYLCATARGRSVLAPVVTTRLMKKMREPAGEKPSERETEVLSLVARGLSNREIARSLHLSEATVKTHLIHVFNKLDVTDRTAAVTVALERGIISLGA